ncbi:MAG: LysR family transcriptional regulator [Burkholderiaceae bacterium]
MTSPQSPGAPRRLLRHGLLPQLAAFEAVVRLGSAARAAESLCIAQSTLSGHLRKLSETLGVRLFELEGKQLVPTAAARALIGTVDEVFDALARCEQALVPLRSAASAGCRERIDNAGPWLQLRG